MRVDYFSGPAAELKKKDRTPENVLAALKTNPRVSTWDMSEHPWLRSCISILERDGLIVRADESYPWHRWMVANKTLRERDDMIHALRARYSAVEIAEMVKLTRQRVHQILNERE